MHQLQDLSPRHEEILNWILMNPNKTQNDCAAAFSITPGWLSQVIHSDMFQARLRERQDQIFDRSVMSLSEKTSALAHEVLDRLHDKVVSQMVNDPGQLESIADMTLKRLGFGAKVAPSGGSAVNQQNNFFLGTGVDAASLKEAQELARAAKALTSPVIPTDDKENAIIESTATYVTEDDSAL